MNKTIYTVIIGDGYKLREPNKVYPGWDYVCYTDQNIKSDVWDIKTFEPWIEFTNRQNSRIAKINHIGTGISLYMDAKFKPINYLDNFVEKHLGDNDVAFMHHPKRNCIYSEAKFLARNNIEPWENINGQLKNYLNEGLPINFGLWAPGIMIKRHSELIERFIANWWNEYISGTERDMISLAYTVWKFPQLKIGVMPFRQTYKRFIK